MIYEGYGDHRGRTGHALVLFYFPANGSTNPDVFQPKTFCIPRGIIPQNFSSLGFAVSEELGNKHPNRQTDSLIDWRFYRVNTNYHLICKKQFTLNLFSFLNIFLIYLSRVEAKMLYSKIRNHQNHDNLSLLPSSLPSL